MHRRHYSAKGNNPKVRQFVGPGEKLVLYHASGLAAMAWRKGIFYDGQQGINNAIFINHGAGLSSQLILEAVFWCGQNVLGYATLWKQMATPPKSVQPILDFVTCKRAGSGLAKPLAGFGYWKKRANELAPAPRQAGPE